MKIKRSSGRSFALTMSIFSALSLVELSACTKKNEDAPIAQKITCENGQVKEVGIFGGETLSSDSLLSKGMVLIYQSMGSAGGAFCTGSLIDSNIVLTAAHCVPPAGANPETVSVYWSVDPICSVVQNGDQSLTRVADKIEVHKSYDLYQKGESDEHGDVAMIRLNEPAPVDAVPAKLLGKSVKLNSKSKILVAGFGKTTDYRDEDSEKKLMRFALVKPYQGAESDTTVAQSSRSTYDLKKENLYFDQTQGQGACAGDSGGPSMIKGQDEAWSVIGVASFVTPLKTSDFEDKNTTCHQGVAYSSVVYYKSWIKKTYESIKNEKSLLGLKWVE